MSQAVWSYVGYFTVPFILSFIMARVVAPPQTPVVVRSCNCGAHWWIRRWFFWRHLDASLFNDQLQNRWTIWMFEFRKVLKLSPAELERMGYPNGPIWEDGRPMWRGSKWQRSISSVPYCLRCLWHEE